MLACHRDIWNLVYYYLTPHIMGQHTEQPTTNTSNELVGSTKYEGGDYQTQPLRNKLLGTRNLHRILLFGE